MVADCQDAPERSSPAILDESLDVSPVATCDWREHDSRMPDDEKKEDKGDVIRRR